MRQYSWQQSKARDDREKEEKVRRTITNVFAKVMRIGRATTLCLSLAAMLTVVLAVALVGLSVMLAVGFGMFAPSAHQGVPRTRTLGSLGNVRRGLDLLRSHLRPKV
jgi:hypothetical protein